MEQLTITQQASSFSGPLPPPESLAEYERISPGFADRIVTMAEKEQGHRHGNEHELWNLQRRLLSRGQVFAFILSLAIVSGGIWLLTMDKAITGFNDLQLTIVKSLHRGVAEAGLELATASPSGRRA